MKKLLFISLLFLVSCSESDVIESTLSGQWQTSWIENSNEFFIDLTIVDDSIFSCTKCVYSIVGLGDLEGKFIQDEWPVLESTKTDNQIRFIFQRPNNKWKFNGTYVMNEIILDSFMEKKSKFLLWREAMVFKRL